jgi:hypothetical protein
MKNLSTKLAGLALGLVTLTASAQTAATFGDLPLYFEAGAQNQFLARGRDAAFSVSPAGAEFALRENSSAAARSVQMQFLGANSRAQISGENELPGKINYLNGNDPAQWRSGVPTFSKVRVGEIYPGINLVYYGSQRQLEYDFTIAAGANPDSIAIHFDGADKISVNTQGGLVLKLGDREILQPKPVVYQTVDGARKEISGGYKILDAHDVAFAVGNYDRAQPLVIDPVLGYSTYFGGTLAETAWTVAVNTNDNSVYVGGQTLSLIAMKKGPPFSTPGALQENFGGGKITGDGFVARFDSTGTNLIFLTYLGGALDDLVSGIALDAAGHVFLTGFTDSSNFPVVNALYPHITGQFNKIAKAYPADIFVAELNTNGASLVYSTYFGGEWNNSANAIAVDSADNVYIAGTTGSTNFPVVNALQNHLAGTNNAFVAEIGAGGSPLVFSTYLGGTNFDVAEGIAVDVNNNILVCGFTDSTNFPTVNAAQPLLNVGAQPKKQKDGFPDDAFIAKLAPSGGSLLYSTFLGSSNEDIAYRIACDSGGNAYVTGFSASPEFTNTVSTNLAGLYSHGGKNNNNNSSDNDVFLTKFDPSGAIVYSALFGGKGSDTGYGIGLDAANDIFIAGATTSTDFPTNNATADGAFRNKNSGATDIFVTAFSASPTNLTALLYSGYLGGKKNDFAYNLAVDATGNAYVAGQTESKNFPLTNAFQPFLNGKSDAILTKIMLAP